MKKSLTSAQQRCFDAIRNYIAKHQISPSIPELQKALGVASPRSITQFLKVLERKGYIMRAKYARRGITLMDDMRNVGARTVQVPVVAWAGCDDAATVFAQEVHDEYIPVDESIVQNKPMLAVRAVGGSMTAAGINDGDYVLVERTQDVKNFQNVVAVVDGMLTIKQLERRPDVTILHPRSKDDRYRPIILSSDFAVIGRVVMVIPIYDDIQFIDEKQQIAGPEFDEAGQLQEFAHTAGKDALSALPPMSTEEYEHYQNL